MIAAPTDIAVAIVPYAERFPEGLSRLPLDRLDWPLGRPERLMRGTVADMAATDHLITYPKTRLYLSPRGARKAQLSLMIVEPDTVHGKHLQLARLFHRRFFRVLTKNRALQRVLPNALQFALGYSFLEDPAHSVEPKRRLASLIASSKTVLEGHKLRHRIVAEIKAQGLPVDVMGRGYRPFEAKAEGLAPYRYSVVVENSREPSYFSEKLIDALLCETEADIMAALRHMSEADYERRKTALAANRATALHLADVHGRAAAAVLQAARG